MRHLHTTGSKAPGSRLGLKQVLDRPLRGWYLLGSKAPGSRLGLREKDTQDARFLLSVSPGCFASTQRILWFLL